MKKKLKNLYDDPHKVDTLLVKAMFLLVFISVLVGLLSAFA
jgi:hypothetical protein